MKCVRRRVRVLPITECRVCGGNLRVAIDLGHLALTGVFPKPSPGTPWEVPITPLSVCRCESCHTSQLRHSYSLPDLFGPTYGYRSALSKAMKEHLRSKASELRWHVHASDYVVDIGSNDGWFLGQFNDNVNTIGVDPLATQFAEHSFYPSSCQVITGFFDPRPVLEIMGRKRAKVVTSIAMLYDVPDPVRFARDVASILAEDGIWHIEVSYWPGLLRLNGFDTICQEHLFYFNLTSLVRILAEADLFVEDISFNFVNGSSVTLDVVKTPMTPPPTLGAAVAIEAAEMGRAEARLAERLPAMRITMRALLDKIRSDGGHVLGLGASTKGNVLLQHFGIELEAIADVNPDKWGCVTPGTKIPIIDEDKALAMKPSHLLVLPWHFRQQMIDRMHDYLQGGGKLIFPLPFLGTYAHE